MTDQEFHRLIAGFALALASTWGITAAALLFAEPLIR
jgi:hypothetical protein